MELRKTVGSFPKEGVVLIALLIDLLGERGRGWGEGPRNSWIICRQYYDAEMKIQMQFECKLNFFILLTRI